MCTLIVLRRPRHEWPIIVAANRDERLSREWEAPDRHWREFPDIIGGWDTTAHGSWFAINESGLVAATLNRKGSLGPQPGKRSRGDLVIEALGHADASTAAEALAQINVDAYAPFNFFLADNQYAYWFKHAGQGQKRIEINEIPEGYSMLTEADRNDFNIPRVRTFLPRFETAKVPDPVKNDWRDWEVLLGNRMYAANVGPEGAMTIVREGEDYGTVCSQMAAIPSFEIKKKPVFLFCNGRPGEAKFESVEI